MGTIPSSGPASATTRCVVAGGFACVAPTGARWDVIQMRKPCSEQGIGIELLGKALVLCCGSANRAKS